MPFGYIVIDFIKNLGTRIGAAIKPHRIRFACAR